jgi:hypothetical protein
MPKEQVPLVPCRIGHRLCRTERDKIAMLTFISIASFSLVILIGIASFPFRRKRNGV